VKLDGEHLVRLIGLIKRDAEAVLPKKMLALILGFVERETKRKTRKTNKGDRSVAFSSTLG
jgi:hypothetical protein